MRIHIDSIYYSKREEDEMKKILTIMLVLILTLCGCSNGDNTHKYADKLNTAINESTISYYSAEELIADYVVKDEENTEYLNYVKKMLRQFDQFDEYNSLNWEAFDKVKSIYWLDSQKVKNIPDGVDLDTWDAAYSKKLSGIIFFPKMSTYSSDQQFHVTTHELCHALLESSNEQKQNAFIIEGEVEFMALVFSRMLEINPEPTYPNGVITAQWLNLLFGSKEVFGAIINNRLDDLIDSVAGDGACHQINVGGGMAESNGSTVGRNAAIEVLCHLSKNLDKVYVGEEYLEYSATFEGVDTRYFKKILSS